MHKFFFHIKYFNKIKKVIFDIIIIKQKSKYLFINSNILEKQIIFLEKSKLSNNYIALHMKILFKHLFILFLSFFRLL